jgi:hypothetical protein
MEGELIDEAATRCDRFLTNAGDAVHRLRYLKAVPMNGGRLWQMVVEDNPNPIPLVDLDRRARSAAVVPPKVNDSAWKNLLFHRLSDQVEDLHSAIHLERQVGHILGVDGNVSPRLHPRHVGHLARTLRAE